MKLPSNKQWTQDNSGDTLGTLGETFNMAMDTAGKARLAKKSVTLYNSTSDEDFLYPLAIGYFEGNYIVVTSDNVFEGSAPSYSFAEAGGFVPLDTGSDGLVYNSLFTVTTSDSIETYDGASWTDRSASLTSGVNHPMAVFGTSLAVGNANTVLLYNTSYTVAQTLTLPTEFRVVTLRAVNDYIYIGTKNLNGSNAKIFIWDGDSTLFNYEVEVGSSWVFAMTAYKSTVAAITSNGQLGLVNGTNFEELAALPVYYDPHARWVGSGGLTLNGKVFNRGMITIGDTIYLNIDGSVDSGNMPQMKSGIWVFDPTVGLYHRASNSNDLFVRDGSITLANNVITTTSTHLLKKGDAVSFDSISGLTGVEDGVNYYVEIVSTTQIKLAVSRKALQAGTYVTISGTPTAGDVLVYTQNTEYYISDCTSGAIIATVNEEVPNMNLTSEILWGSRADTPTNTARYSLYSFANSYNVGHFITQRIYSDNIAQNWLNIYNFIDGLVVDNEQVIVKVQNKYEDSPTILSGVWLTPNKVNSSTATKASFWVDIEPGDELVFVDGTGRGQSAHVVSIEQSGSNFSVTIDENIGTANLATQFYRTNFKKVGQALTLANKNKETLKSAVSDQVKASPWSRIKVELRGFSPAVNMLDLENAVNRTG